MSPYCQHGGIQIYHADCLAVLPNLATALVDFCLVDPPYLVNGSSGFLVGEFRRHNYL